MKKTLFFAALIAATTLASCGGDNPVEPGVTITAEGTQGNIKWVCTSDRVLTISGTGELPGDLHTTWSNLGDKLHHVIVAEGITSLDMDAFSGCDNIVELTLPASLVEMKARSIYHCRKLEKVNIPEGLTTMGNFAFEECTSLKSLTIPASVTTIGLSPFINCLALTSIDVAPNNQNYASLNGVLFDRQMKRLKLYPKSRPGTSYTIPAGVTFIEDRAFSGCAALEEVVCSSSVAVIGTEAFCNCPNLARVTLGEGFRELNWNSFGECPKLRDVTCLSVEIPKPGGNNFNVVTDDVLHVPAAMLASWNTTWTYTIVWRAQFGSITAIE